MDDDRYERGMAVRRAVLGDAHVERATAAAGRLDAPFQRFITESVWSEIWTRPGLERSERSLVTLAILGALGHWDEFAMHLRASRNTGATPERIAEVIFHIAAYAGVPAGNHAFKLLKAEFPDMPGEASTS